ncbi:hypothetical protein [Vibrio variabilis]|uniref:hypothetical protein n=1 Tax=Vibrio variabilis TaxID=990271 RepID=UPI001EFA0B09|nr:hypothetical protein [Vibrio variabilis]
MDQHASMEYNSKGNRICKRDGAACDFYIEDQTGQMDKVAKYIIGHLPFDRLYYYGRNKLFMSVSEQKMLVTSNVEQPNMMVLALLGASPMENVH